MKYVGTRHADKLVGSSEDDAIKGGRGADELWGGKGEDKLWGGKGADTFNFSISSNGSSLDSQIDRIKDFTPGKDQIVLHIAGPIGGVDASLSYDADTGKIFVHHDGPGPQTYAIAKIGKGLSLDDGDLVMA